MGTEKRALQSERNFSDHLETLTCAPGPWGAQRSLVFANVEWRDELASCSNGGSKGEAGLGGLLLQKLLGKKKKKISSQPGTSSVLSQHLEICWRLQRLHLFW